VKHEFHNSTREQVKGYLAEALAIVAELEISDDLREPAFVQAVGLLSNKVVQHERVVPGTGLALPNGAPGL